VAQRYDLKAIKGVLVLFYSILTLDFFGQDYSQHRIPCDSNVYDVHVWNIKKGPKEGYMDLLVVQFLLDYVNKSFANACISFRLCSSTNIPDYNFSFLSDEPKTNEENDLVKMYYKPHCINIYYQQSTMKQDFDGICIESSKKPRFLISYNSILAETPNSFLRQMLLYFGMSSTDFDPTSRELANGSNGKTTGDRIWDTPADPFKMITGIPLQPGYVGSPVMLPLSIPRPKYYYNASVDANGDLYNPMIYNIMAPFGPGYAVPMEAKSSTLTNEQLRWLATHDKQCRANRWK
jgi:hypothetical protein